MLSCERIKKSISWMLIAVLVFCCPFMNISVEAKENNSTQEFLQSAEFEYKNGKAVITVSTDYFKKYDVAVITDAACTSITYDMDFSMNVRINDSYTFAAVYNKNATDDIGNKYAVAIGSGMVTADGGDIPYKGRIVSFIYENVSSGTEFKVVSNSANHVDDIMQAPVMDEFVALSQTAEIEYSNGTAVVTVNTEAFNKYDVAVVSKATCNSLTYSNDFNFNVRFNENYTFACVFNKEAQDNIGNAYAVATGSGMVTVDGAPIPYEGELVSFTFENVKEGTEFLVVSNSANHLDDVTKAPVIAKLAAISQSAEISYDEGTAVITINTEDFNRFDMAVISSYDCTNIAYDMDFSMNVRVNENYTFASVFNAKGFDEVGNKYSVVTGSGIVTENGGVIPYKGKLATFTFENVEEGAEFIVVTNSANYEDITKAPVVARLKAIPVPKCVVDFVVDGEIISSQKVKIGEGAVAPENPTKAEDDTYTYEFIGWDKEFSCITEDTVVTALFKAVKKVNLGDVAKDGKVDATDALDVLKAAAKVHVLDKELFEAADVNKDGTVDSSDALMILKFAARIIDSLE